MSDKITKETLIALAYEDYAKHGIQLPSYAIEWISKHGKPDVNKIFAKQQKTLGKESYREKKEAHAKDRILVENAIAEYGDYSYEAAQRIHRARQHGVTYKLLESWVHKTDSWIKVRADMSDDFVQYLDMQKKYRDVTSPEMARFYRYEYGNGVSLEKMALWASLPVGKIKRLIRDSTPKYEADITYYFEVPTNSTKSERLLMLDGTIKPDNKIDLVDAQERVRQWMETMNVDSDYEMKVDAKYSRYDGLDMKIRPILGGKKDVK